MHCFFSRTFLLHWQTTVNDITVEAEVLEKFPTNLVKRFARAVKKTATEKIKNPGKALETGKKTGSAAKCRNLEAALSTIPDVIIFIILMKDCILEKLLGW